MAPSRSRRTIVASAQAENVAGTTIATRSGWARAARSIARASSAVAAIRASVRTCLPALERGDRDRRVEDRPGADEHRVDLGIGQQRLPRRVRTIDPERLGGARARTSAERLATPTSSTPSIARKRGTCSAATIRPAPTIPILIGSVTVAPVSSHRRRRAHPGRASRDGATGRRRRPGRRPRPPPPWPRRSGCPARSRSGRRRPGRGRRGSVPRPRPRPRIARRG